MTDCQSYSISKILYCQGRVPNTRQKRYNKKMLVKLEPQKCVFRAARVGEGKLAFELISQRVTWMEQRGISQWPREHYLQVFNQDYFEAAAKQGQLWFLEQDGCPAACAVLLEEDERWGYDKQPSWYVHNLASLSTCPGAGALFLTLTEREAARRGKRYVRLDCLTGARKLNAYYRQKGYRFAGYWKQPQYRGNLRQKLIQTEGARAANG